jgi:hypothetical protein
LRSAEQGRDGGNEIVRGGWRLGRGQRHGNKIGAGPAQGFGLVRVFHVEGDARHLENLSPPRDQLVAAHARLVAFLQAGRCGEGNVVGAGFGKAHGVVARDARIDADDAAGTERVARLRVGRRDAGRRCQVHAIGAQSVREVPVVGEECGGVGALGHVDERLGAAGIEGGAGTGHDQRDRDVARRQGGRQTLARARSGFHDGIEAAVLCRVGHVVLDCSAKTQAIPSQWGRKGTPSRPNAAPARDLAAAPRTVNPTGPRRATGCRRGRGR